MKKHKINLESLKVTSFITSIKHEQIETIKGGDAQRSHLGMSCTCPPDHPDYPEEL